MPQRTLALVASGLLMVVVAGTEPAPTGCEPTPGDAGTPVVDGGAPACTNVTTGTPLVVATALTADDFGITLAASSASATRWKEVGNEALVLEVTSASRGLIGHMVLHQGATTFHYKMQLGRLAANETVSVKVSSTLSAASATKQACVGDVSLTSATALGTSGDLLRNAPIFHWPVKKRFDDIPVIVGWSAAKKGFQTVYSNENGGTIQLCGGGADGVQALLARYGRPADIEGMYTYGTPATWMRCTGDVAPAAGSPRMESTTHPIFYYGSGHNKLFESRGGYGVTCGTALPEMADGNIDGWNVNNPGNAPANDLGRTIILRPWPVALDSLDYANFSGRREALLDKYAPWVYRLSFAELEREGKVDNNLTLPMDRYLFVDVHAAEVNGLGDRVCWGSVNGGFLLSAKTATATFVGPQMTAFFFGGADNWKRLAIPVPAGTTAASIKKIVIDAFDNDGIYLLGIGDAFLARPSGDNGATLERVRTGVANLKVYVDDANLNCVNGVTSARAGGPYTCAGSLYEFAIP